MSNWKIFEEKAVDFIRNNLLGENAEIEALGSTNSRKVDAAIKSTSNENKINLEFKYLPSQSGQFVLFQNNETSTFDFSCKNFFKKCILPETSNIIGFMNDNFDKFKNPSTKRNDLIIDNNVLVKWVKDFYKIHKKVLYLVVGNSKSLKCTLDFKKTIFIFPIEKLNEYLDVSATYRIKKSGTSNFVTEEESLSVNGKIYKLKKNKKKSFIDGFLDLNEDQKKQIKEVLETNIDRLHIAKSGELRKKSKTENANVIFSLKLKKNTKQSASHLAKFESAVNCI